MAGIYRRRQRRLDCVSAIHPRSFPTTGLSLRWSNRLRCFPRKPVPRVAADQIAGLFKSRFDACPIGDQGHGGFQTGVSGDFVLVIEVLQPRRHVPSLVTQHRPKIA